MKTLKLKMQDLTNPTILTHHEIKNILGGGTASEVSRCYDSYTHCTVGGGSSDDGNCETNSNNKCVCNNGTQSIISSTCVK